MARIAAILDPNTRINYRHNQARFQVPTLRNVDKRPDPGFVKAHGHNGYFTSLKAIVHFYNTRDAWRAASPMMPVKVRHAGRRPSRPPT
jgi:cytochrome c peroxidase